MQPKLRALTRRPAQIPVEPYWISCSNVLKVSVAKVMPKPSHSFLTVNTSGLFVSLLRMLLMVDWGNRRKIAEGIGRDSSFLAQLTNAVSNGLSRIQTPSLPVRDLSLRHGHLLFIRPFHI